MRYTYFFQYTFADGYQITTPELKGSVRKYEIRKHGEVIRKVKIMLDK